VSFLGPQTIYKLRSRELGDLTVTASTHGAQHRVGSLVRVTWPLDSVWVVSTAEGERSAALPPAPRSDEPEAVASQRSPAS
jgi:hypothetical protein